MRIMTNKIQFEPTGQQVEAIKKLNYWWKNRTKQVFQIAGIAGSGKSSMINYFINDIGLNQCDVAFATYTGKAALVLQRKGVSATTIHKLIYRPIPYEEVLTDSKGNIRYNKDNQPMKITKVRFEKRNKLEDEDVKLIVLDECSMINQSMWNDLLTFNLPIIVLGDRGQLDPIHGKQILLVEPDIELTEPLRQAIESPIIYLSMLAREGKDIPLGKYSAGVHVVPHDSPLITDRILSEWADIILCGRNTTRTKINDHIRYDILERSSSMPEKGDKLICRRNNWNLMLPNDNIPLVNGMIGYVDEHIDKETIGEHTFNLDFKPDFTTAKFNLEANRKVFESKDTDVIQKEMKFGKGEKFEYGYAITTHLSQGSEWKNVVVYEEILGGLDKHKKWLYTAITRSSKNLIIVKREQKKKVYF